jgi:hypothetical protein
LRRLKTSARRPDALDRDREAGVKHRAIAEIELVNDTPYSLQTFLRRIGRQHSGAGHVLKS